MEQESKRIQADLKREKRKQRERKAKSLLKLRLGMETPLDIGVDAASIEHFADQDYTLEHLKMNSSMEQEEMESDKDVDPEQEDEEDESIYDSDQEVIAKVSNLETEIDELYNNYLSRKSKKDIMNTIKKQKEGAAAEFEEWYGVEYDEKKQSLNRENASDSDSVSDTDSDSDSNTDSEQEDSNSDLKKRKNASESDQTLSKKAKLFFENPIFKGMTDSKKSKKSMFDKDMNDHSFDSDNESDSSQEKISSKKKKSKELKTEKTKDFEVVPAPTQSSDADGIFLNLLNRLILYL